VGNQGITLIISVLILIKYFRLLGSADVEIASGNTFMLRSLLAGIFVAWLFLPIGFSRPIISSRELLHLPLSPKELFAIRIVSLLMMPYSLMVAAASLAICYPLAHAPEPLAAIAAALLFIAMSCSTGLAIAHLLSMAAWRRLLFAVLVLASAAVAYVLSGNDAARYSQFSWALPAELVCRAVIGKNPTLAIGLLVALNCLALALAWWSFRQSLVRGHKARSSKRIDSILFGLPGPAGA